jgi:uncharacterized protein involved in exopolysaccharide biosynthesis
MTALQIRPAEVFKAFWRDKWIVIGIGLFAGALSVAYALTRVPMYTSEAVLASPEDDKSGFGALTGMLGQVSALTGVLGVPSFGGASVEEVTAVLKSRDFSVRFIRNHELLPELYPEKKWRKISVPASPAALPATALTTTMAPRASGNELGFRSADGSQFTVEDILDSFDLMRTITVDRRTGFVSLKVRARQPELAQHIAQAMITDINEELRRRALGEARRAEEFLNQKIASVQFESIKNTAAALLESQLKREVLAESRSDFALRVLDPPSLPEMRSYPKRTRMVFIGGFIGALVAALVVFVRLRRRSAAAV